MQEQQPGEAGSGPYEPPTAPDRAEEQRVDTPQGGEPVATEGTDTGAPDEGTEPVEGRHNDDLPTESPVASPDPENRAADQGGPGHTDRLSGEGEQPAPVVDDDNQAADRGGLGHTDRLAGSQPDTAE